MHISVVGLNHKTAPVELREHLAVPAQQLPDALAQVRRHADITECVIVSTCNRTEAYTTSLNSGYKLIPDELAALSGLPAKELAEHLYTHLDSGAVRHLFRVASGVDSMILGEPQVLGQVREAYEEAVAQGTTGPVLNRLFESALATGKRVRTETDINRGAFSVGSAAVELAHSIFGDTDGRRVLLLGAGEMSEIVADRLMRSGAASVLVANRTYHKAQALAEKFGGRAVRYEDFEVEMRSADIVITSTGAPHFILRHEQLNRIMLERKMRPIFLIDIAVPRDIDPSVSDIDCVFLYDIDDLNSIVSKTASERQAEVTRAERIIEHEVLEFLKWRNSLLVVPVIRGLRGKLEKIAGEELERYSGKLSHLEDKDREVVSELVRSLVNKISHHPITHIKDYANSDGAEQLQTVVEVFGIDHEEAEQEESNVRGLGT